MAKPDSQWYRLDNAGILYSALQREEYSAIYRFSALMTEPVRPAALQNAIDRVLPRFPSFAVRIRRGLFWYYLEPNTAPGPFLKADVANPCQPVRFREDNGWLVRFYYYRNRISLEVFHALSDGAGALIFFRTLLEEYFMSYCVNCGVELDPSAKTCPLCGTPAWHPELDAPPYFPANSAAVQPASRREAAILLTAMLVSVSLCCGLLNLFLPTDRPWSLYVIGAAVMLWVWFTLPMVLRRLPVFFRLTADVAAIGIYVWLISIDLGGSRWFRGLALPMNGWAGVLVFLLSFLLRGGRRSTLSAIALIIGAAGLLAMGIEFCIDRYFRGVWQPGWSLIVLAVCVGLIIPLRIVRRVPSLREEARRRFNL